MKLPNIRQTKLLQATFCQLVATLAMFMGLADFTQWAAFSGTLFTLYGVANVMDTHLQQSKGISLENQTA